MSPPERILLTGATGNLGTKAASALREAGFDDLVLLDADTRERPDVLAADLSSFDRRWAQHFDRVDVVVHLAADSRETAGWDDVIPHNIDASLNVFRAAEDASVDRVVFASSNWVLGGHRFSRAALRSDTPPRPVNPYGASKLFIERAGYDLAARAGLTFVPLRLGYCQVGENVPGPQMEMGRWGQEMWLSNDDWRQAVVLACTRPLPVGGVPAVNLMSRNDGMRWDLSESERVLDYRPRAAHDPQMPAMSTVTDRLARLRERWIARDNGEPAFGSRW